MLEAEAETTKPEQKGGWSSSLVFLVEFALSTIAEGYINRGSQILGASLHVAQNLVAWVTFVILGVIFSYLNRRITKTGVRLKVPLRQIQWLWQKTGVAGYVFAVLVGGSLDIAIITKAEGRTQRRSWQLIVLAAVIWPSLWVYLLTWVWPYLWSVSLYVWHSALLLWHAVH